MDWRRNACSLPFTPVPKEAYCAAGRVLGHTHKMDTNAASGSTFRLGQLSPRRYRSEMTGELGAWAPQGGSARTDTAGGSWRGGNGRGPLCLLCWEWSPTGDLSELVTCQGKGSEGCQVEAWQWRGGTDLGHIFTEEDWMKVDCGRVRRGRRPLGLRSLREGRHCTQAGGLGSEGRDREWRSVMWKMTPSPVHPSFLYVLNWGLAVSTLIFLPCLNF